MRRATLERYTGKGRGGKYRWRVLANGRRIAGTTEGYINEADAERAVTLTLEALLRDLPEADRERWVRFIRNLDNEAM